MIIIINPSPLSNNLGSFLKSLFAVKGIKKLSSEFAGEVVLAIVAPIVVLHKCSLIV